MATARSFLLEVSDRSGALCERFSVPVEGAALFTNQLFRMLPGGGQASLREPWYELRARRLATGPLSAATLRPELPRTSPPVTIEPDPADPIRAIRVTLYDLERVLYTADYSTVEVFGALLTYLLVRRINTGALTLDQTPFRLRVVPQIEGGDVRIFELLPEDLVVEGVFPLTARRSGRRTTFELVTRHTYEPRELVSLGTLKRVKPELGGAHRLIWRREAARALLETQPVSGTVEVGGYLVGEVYAQADAPETLLVEVQQVLAAEATSASAALLLFSGDSWSAVRRRLAGDLRGLRLLGWWHTHLFPASDSFGLSGLDESLHRQFFASPWQFAALLNVSREQGRVLRCYQKDAAGELAESTYDLIEE